ncbi:hypothetical protein [Salibacterium aidingense]|nr:hypothetical protein [Salibacterium aidingense]
MSTTERRKLIKDLEMICGLPRQMLTRLNNDELKKLYRERIGKPSAADH